MLAFWFRAASIDNRDCACRGRFAAGGAEEKEKLAIGVPVTFTVVGGCCPLRLAVGVCCLSAGWGLAVSCGGNRSLCPRSLSYVSLKAACTFSCARCPPNWPHSEGASGRGGTGVGKGLLSSTLGVSRWRAQDAKTVVARRFFFLPFHSTQRRREESHRLLTLASCVTQNGVPAFHHQAR
jgi:hypothetical protein